jgi:putative transposase
MLVRLLRARSSLLLENLALRQQLAVLKRRQPRPRLDLLDRFFWVAVRRFWSGWQQSLIAVTPKTVVRWQRGGFCLYWKLISKVRRPVGRRPTSKEVRELIFRMVVENPTWGAPRIHGELLMLGFDVSERTISRWMKRATGDRELAKRWLTFLRNHLEAIAAMDFFTVPTIAFSMSSWIVQQLREAFPFGSAPRFAIFDRDAKYGREVPAAVRSLGVSPARTSFESPWQNGVAERWVGSWTREGNARRKNSHLSLRSRPFSCVTGRAAPPERSGCLIRSNIGSRKRPGCVILIDIGVPRGRSSGRDSWCSRVKG